MKHQKQLLTVLLMSVACMLQAQRSETLLEKNWKFSKGDFPEAAQTDYNDTKWESVVIPHDWAIFGPFDVNNDLQNVAVTQNFEKKASLKTGRTGAVSYTHLMRGDEALQAITYFVDDAILVGMDRVRILHGTGTGILRTLILQYLSTVPGVSHYADEHVQFGGAGITVVDFD